MNETRLVSYEATVDILNDNPHLSNMEVLFLSEIAGSLAAIADCMTEKKEGDAE